MCGRFVGFRPLTELMAYFPIDVSNVDASENFNVAPSQEVLAIARYAEKNHLVKFNWGLVPFWAKDKRIGNRMINARSETAASKPSFRNAFRKKRCLILADGFYEWTGDKGRRQPMFLTLPDGNPFAFAGLWETWDNQGKEGPPYRSCTIITREASASVRSIHHRMPVILRPEAYGPWLDPDNQDVSVLQKVIQNQICTELAAVSVSRQVNSVKYNRPDNIQPLDPK
jgi:putative SOS response-associated peptidase YedK